MKIYEVLNVGQGDSIIIRPPESCKYCDETILVDLGPGCCDITERIDPKEKVHIFLTHHDNDHLEGLRFFMGKMDQVKEITVPLYQNEVTLIADAILNLKGIYEARDCDGLIRRLEEVKNNQRIIKKVTESGKEGPRLTFASDNRQFCRHIKCLNPPILVETYDWLGEMDLKDVSALVHELFSERFAVEMTDFIQMTRSEMRSESRSMNMQELNDYWLSSREQEIDRRLAWAKGNYVLGFVMGNTSLLRRFNRNGSRKILEKIYKNYGKYTHDVCTVLRMNYNNTTMLLTGDASKKVFRRLIDEGQKISADYLKMPHHGSCKNIDKAILDYINPKVAIISHNNRRFGKGKDPHPNMEVLDMLSRKGIKILITNDVIKSNKKIMDKSKHKDDDYVDIL